MVLIWIITVFETYLWKYKIKKYRYCLPFPRCIQLSIWEIFNLLFTSIVMTTWYQRDWTKSIFISFLINWWDHSFNCSSKYVLHSTSERQLSEFYGSSTNEIFRWPWYVLYMWRCTFDKRKRTEATNPKCKCNSLNFEHDWWLSLHNRCSAFIAWRNFRWLFTLRCWWRLNRCSCNWCLSRCSCNWFRRHRYNFLSIRFQFFLIDISISIGFTSYWKLVRGMWTRQCRCSSTNGMACRPVEIGSSYVLIHTG